MSCLENVLVLHGAPQPEGSAYPKFDTINVGIVLEISSRFLLMTVLCGIDSGMPCVW